MEDFEHIRKLIGLKRYETPGDEYFDRFYRDFKERQRAELLRVPAHQLIRDRLEAWVTPQKRLWMGAAAAAALTVVGVALSLMGPSEERPEALAGGLAEVEKPLPVVTSLLQEF